MQDEETLIRAIQHGEKESYRVLVEKYKDRLFSIAYSFTQSYEEAKDLSQEAFVKAWRAISSFRFNSSFYTYLYRILINLCKDNARRDKFKWSYSLDDEDANVKEPATQRDARHEASNCELARKLDEAIQTLPFKQKSAFILRHIHGLSSEEAAKMLRCKVGTVKAQLHFAIMKLRAYTEKEGLR